MTPPDGDARSRVDMVIAAFGARDWDTVVSAGVSRAWNPEEFTALDAELGDHESAGLGEMWSDAEERGSALHAVGLILANDGRDSDALELLLAAEAAGVDCDLELGETYRSVGDWPAAEERFRRVLADHRDDHEASHAAYRLGEHAAEIDGRTDDEVVGLLKAGMAQMEESVVVLARVYRDRGEPDIALRLLEGALADNDLVPLALGNLLLDDFADVEGAQRAYEEGFARGDAFSALNLAVLLDERLDRPDEAVEWMRRAARGGDAAARAYLTAAGEDGWADDAADPPLWVRALYDDALLPYIEADPLPDPDRSPAFVIDGDRPVPSPGVLARVGHSRLRVIVAPRDGGFDLHWLGTSLSLIRNLTLADSAGTRGWSALAGARALEYLEMAGAAPDEPVDLAALPNLRFASVEGANAFSVCANSNVRDLSITVQPDDPTPEISAPVEFIGVEASDARAVLAAVAHSEQVREVVVVRADRFDCEVLTRFPALREVSLQECRGVVNTAALGRIPGLVFLEVEDCRDVDDEATVMALIARLNAADRDDVTAAAATIHES